MALGNTGRDGDEDGDGVKNFEDSDSFYYRREQQAQQEQQRIQQEQQTQQTTALQEQAEAAQVQAEAAQMQTTFIIVGFTIIIVLALVAIILLAKRKKDSTSTNEPQRPTSKKTDTLKDE